MTNERPITSAHYIATFDDGTSIAVYRDGLVVISNGAGNKAMFTRDWYDMVIGGKWDSRASGTG